LWHKEQLAMTDQWYLSRKQERYGPYTWRELQSYARDGRIDANDLIWSPEAGEWLSPAKTPGLFAERQLLEEIPQPESAPTVAPVRAPADAAPAPIAAPNQAAAAPRPARRLAPGLVAALVTLGLVALAGGVYALFLRDTDETAALANRSPQAPTPAKTVAEPELGVFWQSAEIQTGTAAMDGGDWRDYPDVAAEQTAIAETLAGFGDAMRAGDLDAAVNHVAPDQQEAYRELFAANPDGMASFGELLAEAEMSFLSAHTATSPYNRTAEYVVELDGVTFYLVFIKTESGWMLYDF
jgi:hypothetical protein